ncbi:phosphonate C-P lyase system protein PhnG [Halodesulfovibrio marinisediminis]|uniref:Alpha-D-ribose 1-methylphosphonate 5-triphosphate synthase subunit PhnG n=1 Tax=Halodesulfovibrio marinisediminis DSM 17456 TaxID=1121457 RepID=A0A1N6DWQ3_9BACT|nr:phosphonate C-P lyase system protein PhnG [Halodesulfovibrio marinisediminis]SIN75180.1 alpha-D-ribose 1-methylphosphonate 5-triphosphate synthase subunit PhnG [Halodesulfovibrio marinisediminis DSM 17456]
MNQIQTENRQHWMSVLARTSLADIQAAWSTLSNKPKYSFLRQPETGLAMIQARTNGSGSPFNMGEITLTRCAVAISNTIGHAFIAGRDKRHAELAAVFDGLLQDPDRNAHLTEAVIKPMEEKLMEQRQTKAKKVASTRVDFFTMVRGED